MNARSVKASDSIGIPSKYGGTARQRILRWALSKAEQALPAGAGTGHTS